MTQAPDSEIHSIIESGRVRERVHGPLRPVLLLSVLTMTLLWLSFTPIQAAPLAWIALTPICLLIRLPVMTFRHYAVLTFCAWIWGMGTLQWMRLGHPSMYLAMVALGFYLSLYLPAFVLVSRRIAATGIPAWVAAPLVWTSLEFLRTHLITGFPWYFLGHSQYRWTSLIQIADVTGTYGITLLIALSAAVIAEFIPQSLCSRLGLPAVHVVSPGQRFTAASVCILLLGISIGYGTQRQRPANDADGPVIALVQGNFPPSVKQDPHRYLEMVNEHDLLTRRAAREQPDLIVWPETMWPSPDWAETADITETSVVELLSRDKAVPVDLAADIVKRLRKQETREALVNRSQESGTALMIGLQTHVATRDSIRQYNSAAFIRPDLGYIGRYDKIHRVIFGEYVPLKETLPILARLTPYGNFGIEAGESPQAFELRGVRYAPVICFEDTIPQLIRRIVNQGTSPEDRPDVLVNLTNDGWFHGSSELDQHLITSIFRCVETRRPMVRAVNGGISAFIDSSGRIRDPEKFLLMKSSAGFDGEFESAESMINPKTGKWYRQCSGIMTGQIPLDGRMTIYLMYGDWFAMLCSAVVVALFVRGFAKQPATSC